MVEAADPCNRTTGASVFYGSLMVSTILNRMMALINHEICIDKNQALDSLGQPSCKIPAKYAERHVLPFNFHERLAAWGKGSADDTVGRTNFICKTSDIATAPDSFSVIADDSQWLPLRSQHSGVGHMDRRHFIGSALAAGWSASALAAGIKASKPSIGIVGGGIVGAAIAMQCAKAGARVTLMEKSAPASGATSKSLAWINAFMDDPYYMRMRLDGLRRWQLLDQQMRLGIVWGGYVGFTDRESDRGRMAKQSRTLAEAGHPTRSLTIQELKRISPAIDPGNLLEATYSELGGHVDPVYATKRFLEAAKAAGARIVYPCPVTAIEPTTSGVAVVTSRGRKTFDRLLVATGVEAPTLLQPLGYTPQLNHSPGALVHSKPLPILSRMVYDGPGALEWKQAANGSIVGLEASLPPQLPVHEQIRREMMEFPPGIAEMHGTRILSKFAKYMPGLANAQLDYMTLGFRPMPTDGFPIVGPVPGVDNVSICVTHSGVSLAALLGDFMATELVNGGEEAVLAPYRPSRSMPAPVALPI